MDPSGLPCGVIIPTPTPTLAPVPAIMPIGIIALVGLLSVIAAMSISISIRKKRQGKIAFLLCLQHMFLLCSFDMGYFYLNSFITPLIRE